MTKFAFHFLGQFHVTVGTDSAPDFHSDKARALLAYVALEPQEHARIALATLLWPEIGDKYARTNLRNTIHRLRHALDTAAPGAAEQLLKVTRHTVQFIPKAAEIDVLRFQMLLDSADASAEANLDRLDEVVTLYQGELLASFGITDAPAFEEWLLFRRELLHQQALLAFRTLTDDLEASGYLEQAYTAAMRLLALAPYREESYRQLMRLLTHLGKPDQALNYLEKARQVLHDELGVELSAETLELAKEIASGGFDKKTGSPRLPILGIGDKPILSGAEEMVPAHPAIPSTSHPSSNVIIGGTSSPSDPSSNAVIGGTLSPSLDLRDVPDPGSFFGRIAERQQLARWLLVDRCRVVAILGIGGIGKTSLAAHSIRELAMEESSQLDTVLWHSLVNAPPLAELLSLILQIFLAKQLAEVPDSLDGQLRLLLSYLREKRVLLVLDNMESILEPGQAGAYRVGYEAYGQLIQQVATLEHQSHLMLTSRERPSGYGRLERDSHWIQSLQLSGMGNEAGCELLAARGLAGAGEDESRLIKRYSGNPLALKLVADTVDELYAGDLNEFLGDDTLIFDDIRAVLDQQFDRLTDLEQQILFWLAVEREATPIALLRKNFLQPPTQRTLVEALRGLQRRSLVEGTSAEFGLQNVVTEYLTDRLVLEVIAEVELGEFAHLERHSLLKAQTKEYTRQSQERLLLQPVINWLLTKMGKEMLEVHFKHLLEQLRQRSSDKPGYTGGNLLNLLLHLPVTLSDFDFSHLYLGQAHLRGVQLSNVNFAYADLTDSVFSQTFGEVSSIAISPDGQLLASGAESGEITVWRLSDYQIMTTLTGHGSHATEVIFSPSGQHLVSSSIDATIRKWEVATGQLVWTIENEQHLVYSVAYSSDGQFIASGGSDSFVSVWDSNSTKLVCQLETSRNGATRAVAFHPDGNLLGAASIGGSIFLWDIKTLHGAYKNADVETANLSRDIVRYTIPASKQESYITLGFSPDGMCFAGGDDRGVIRIWDVETRQQRMMLQGHHSSVRNVEFSPDNDTLVSSSFDQTVRLWDVANGACDAILAHNGVAWAATFSPDGKTLVSCGEDTILRIYDVQPQRRAALIKMIQGYRCIIRTAAFSPAEPILAMGDTLGTIRLWDISQHEPQLVHTLHGHDRVEALTFSPDGRFLISAGGIDDYAIRIWDTNTKECLSKLVGHAQRVRSLAFSPDGSLFASAGEDATIRLWQFESSGDCRTRYVLCEHQNIIYHLSFNGDGSRLASSSHDYTIRIWETANGKEIQQIAGLGGNELVAFSPRADRLACSAGTTEGVRLLDVSDPQATKNLITLTGHVHEPVSASFHPDGSLLVTASSDHSVRLWDTTRGKQLYVREHKAYVDFITFSHDGRCFFSSSNDGVGHLWETDSGRCLYTFYAPRPYEGMNITGVTGISEAQRVALKALGAVEE